MKKYKTQAEILARVKKIKAIQNNKSKKEQGILEMELDLLYVDYKNLEVPNWSENNPFSKHPW